MIMWTKRQIIEQSFEELGLAAYAIDLQPEQIESARRKLDTMVAGWSSKNVQVGYPLPSEANSSDVDQQTNIPDYAIDALVFGLAVRLAPSMGKVVAAETRLAAHNGYQDLLRMAVKKPPQMKFASNLPLGAGNRHCNTFIGEQSDSAVLTPNQEVGFFNE